MCEELLPHSVYIFIRRPDKNSVQLFVFFTEHLHVKIHYNLPTRYIYLVLQSSRRWRLTAIAVR